MATAWPEREDLRRIGMVLGGLALAWYGLRRRGVLGAGFMAVGGVLAGAGMTRPLAETASGWSEPITVTRSITIAKPRAEVYRFWRDFSNLARFMRHVERIDVHSDRRSRWVVRAPLGGTVEWIAEIDDERENEAISWYSAPGADVPSSGVVTFRDGPGRQGTELIATITYEPPAGELGQQIARLLGEEPGTQAQEDLARLKQILETGEVATAGPR